MKDDYIRREEAITEICDCTCGELKDVCKSQEGCSYYEALKLLPSADVAPVVHGVWLDGYKTQTCSLCKFRGKKSWTFCPHCGAKMDVQGKE